MQVQNLTTQLPNTAASLLRSRLSPCWGRRIIAALVMAGCADQTPTAVTPTALERSLASAHDHPGMNAAASGVPSVPGGFTVQPLARGSFPDDVAMTFKIRLNRGTNVAHVNSPSDALVARITLQPGGSFGWHTHHGPVIVTVASGALNIINASDCLLRTYEGGKAFVDPGQGNVHVGFNGASGETVVYATFLDVPAGQAATIPANPACDS